MKITIRPAPHSKSCAHSGNGFCSKFKNQPERCETECPAGWCCEMKHCWELGEKLRDILIARGHEVMMANKKYRKGYPESKANENMKLAIEELMAWNPDVHMAIHTNSASSGVTGVRIGYPAVSNNRGEEARCERSYLLAYDIAQENKKIYHTPDKVKTCTYNFYELNKPTCTAVYIEGCFANSNKKDAEWWHNNMEAIAKSYADGIEKWWLNEGHSLPDGTKIEIKPVTTAIINTVGNDGLSLWTSYAKREAIIKIKKNEVVNVLSLESDHDFFHCEYKGNIGYIDGQYLLFENTEDKDFAIINTKSDSGLSLWDSYKKKEKKITVKKGEVVDILSDIAVEGFYYCEYNDIRGYADGQYLDFIAKEETEDKTPVEPEIKPNAETYAIINTKYDSGLSLWDSYKKGKAVIKVAKGEKVQVLSTNPDHGFYLCEYKGKEGYADGQYLKFDDAGGYVTATINTKYDAGLSLWDSYRKNTSLIKVKKGEKVEVKSLNDDHGFYLCEYKDVEGYADGQYLLF